MCSHHPQHEALTWRTERRDQDPVEKYLGKLSPRSRRTMRRSLDAIACLVSGLDDDQMNAGVFRWEALTPQVTAKVSIQLLGRGLAPATVNKMLAALRGVLGACRDMDLIDHGQYQQLAGFKKLPADAEPDSRRLNDEEVNQLLNTAEQDDSVRGRRDTVALRIFLCCGPRRSEVSELQFKDYEPAEGVLVIQGGKPGRRRRIPLDAPTSQAIDRWLEVRGHAPGPLLMAVNKSDLIAWESKDAGGDTSGGGDSGVSGGGDSEGGDSGGSGGVGDQGVYEMLRRLGKRAGLETVRSRDLRRTAVVRMILGGLDYEQVQQRCGRMSWLTPEAYEELTKEAQTLTGRDASD